MNDERFAKSSQGVVKQTLLGAGSEVRWYIGTVWSDGKLGPVMFALKEPRQREVGMCWMGVDGELRKLCWFSLDSVVHGLVTSTYDS